MFSVPNSRLNHNGPRQENTSRWIGITSAALFTLQLTTAQNLSFSFSEGIEFGQILETELNEISGIEASENNPGVLWVHNDGSANRLFAISTDGALLGTYEFEGNPDDIEDITLGPGPIAGAQYIYAGDIGDNLLTRNSVRIYRIPEPSVYPYFADDPISENLKGSTEIKLVYPDGSHDAEALMIDPQTGDLLIATKEFGFSQIYRASRDALNSGATIPLNLAQEIPMDDVSGADISSDGQEILIRSETAALLWERNPGESVPTALRSFPWIVPVIGPPFEPNGEGITFDPDGLGYYTLSEGVEQPLFFFDRLDANIRRDAVTIIPPGSTWRFLDDGSNQGIAWRTFDFDDQHWSVGQAQFGYGEHDERTKIRFGNDSDDKTITTYLRKSFQFEDITQIQSLNLTVLYDDGIAVFLNGTAVLHSNLATGAPFSERAAASNSDLENIWLEYALNPGALRNGRNVLAIELHRRSQSEKDLSFDTQLHADLKQRPLQFSKFPTLIAAHWQFEIEGPSGGTVFIDSSSDLESWNTIGSLNLPAGIGTFRDPRPNPGQVQFYRLRQ